MITILLISFTSETATADETGRRPLDPTASLSPNAVPMMGKKDAAPREVPSFTSGYLPPAFPQYLRGRPSKREPGSYPSSWHIGKRQPVNKPWLANLSKQGAVGKRSATPTEWNSPWYKMPRSGQQFRFHDGGSNLQNSNLVYKRSPEDITRETEYLDLASSEADGLQYLEYGGLMDDASLVRMICSHLFYPHCFQYPPQMGLFDRTLLTRVQRDVARSNR